jgi:hypothetical protein
MTLADIACRRTYRKTRALFGPGDPVREPRNIGPRLELSTISQGISQPGFDGTRGAL